jgi:hypothetical protein
VAAVSTQNHQSGVKLHKTREIQKSLVSLEKYVLTGGVFMGVGSNVFKDE